MAEGTRLQQWEKRMEGDILNLKEMTETSISELREDSKRNMAEVMDAMADLRRMIVGIAKEKFGESSNSIHPVQQQESDSYTELGGVIKSRTTRLEFPHFDGDDPNGWIYRAEQFFKYNFIPENQKVTIASFHLEKEALQWYQWMEKSRGRITWKEFVIGLCTRFGPSVYEDFTGELTKLRQTATVREYQSRFEQLANRTVGLTEEFFVSCFVSGLNEEIKHDVRMFRPTTMTEAIGLARLKEEQLLALPKPNVSQPIEISPVSNENSISLPTPVKRLTSAEANERREKGLCFNCDEKFKPGHHCKTKQLFLIDDNWFDDLPKIEAKENYVKHLDNLPPEISLHAITGVSSPQTMRVKAELKKQPITVLIDSGSTHNFIHPKLVKRLNIRWSNNEPLDVMVASGERIQIQGTCDHLPISIQGFKFTSEYYMLPIRGCDVVLGAHWLCTLGPILWDFSKLLMQFKIQGQKYTLKGFKDPPIETISSHAIEKNEVTSNSTIYLYSIKGSGPVLHESSYQNQSKDSPAMLSGYSTQTSSLKPRTSLKPNIANAGINKATKSLSCADDWTRSNQTKIIGSSEKLLQVNFADKHVIIPQHFRVTESECKQLVFGSFEAEFYSTNSFLFALQP